MIWLFLDDDGPEAVEYDTNYESVDIRRPYNPRSPTLREASHPPTPDQEK
jgi:hypothetical protein